MSGPSNSPDNKSGADKSSTEEPPPSFDELSSERQKTVMQAFLLYNIVPFAERSVALTPKRYVDALISSPDILPSYHKTIKLDGPPTGIINKLTMV